jgi:hypothetical protein
MAVQRLRRVYLSALTVTRLVRGRVHTLARPRSCSGLIRLGVGSSTHLHHLQRTLIILSRWTIKNDLVVHLLLLLESLFDERVLKDSELTAISTVGVNLLLHFSGVVYTVT